MTTLLDNTDEYRKGHEDGAKEEYKRILEIWKNCIRKVQEKQVENDQKRIKDGLLYEMNCFKELIE